MPENKLINFDKFLEETAKILKDLGFEVVPKKRLVDFYLHKYNSYEQYKESQIRLNKKKLDLIWADENTLKKVSNIVETSLGRQKKDLIIFLEFVMVLEMDLNKIF